MTKDEALTLPPVPERPWVGLTDEDVSNALTKYHGWREFAHELETILRGKNT